MFRNKTKSKRKKSTFFSVRGGGVDGPKTKWRDVMGTYHRTKKSRDYFDNYIN